MRYSRNEKIDQAIKGLLDDDEKDTDKMYEIVDEISGKAMSMARELEKYGVNIFFDNFKKSAVIIRKKDKKKKPKWRLI